ncbi:AMIN domain-containing protein [Crassaminicella thermophila]|uniref:AMIN domain-containing protein n=1 Tax=Crassaminicella thermophila TaxID=2599308 RepID=A0A5C0SJ31_CRATE|nr:N-acetylmuramoyl-L-alanine amidase [Crassaminicella thermophila]QEK12959.1 AMIN domain-containing protein [Crassaminicella thermophila]
MKRLLAIIFVICIFFGMSSTIFGLEAEQSIIEIKDGISAKVQKVHRVNLLMGGKDVYTDVPPVLYTINNKSRTLVPIRFVVEGLGANIEWNQERREATIVAKEKKIILKIDSAIAIVNGKKYKLPNNVPAKLLGYQGNYRTMVPLRFIAEQLGMDVNWKQETTTAMVDLPEQYITNIAYENTGNISKMIIKTTGAVNFTTMYLPGSKFGGNDRLIIDIPNTNINIKDSYFEENNGLFKKEVNMDGIKTIRGSLFETKPRKVSRIVLDLNKPKGYDVSFDEESNELSVAFLNNVRNIKLEERNHVNAVVIHTEESPVYNIMDFGNKVVVDVLNAKLKFNKNEIFVGKQGIKKIRTAQFAPDANYDKDDKIVRVVLDLEEGQSFENIFVDHEGTDILVYINDKPMQELDYQKEDINQSRLKLSLHDQGEYYIDYAPVSNAIVLKVPKDKIELTSTELNIDDNMVKAINIEDEIDDIYYYITIKLTDGTDYSIEANGIITDEIIIRLQNRKIGPSKYTKKLIVIDPGHGGKDPGTSNKELKLLEKDLALDTAMRLKELLEEAGFDTFITRDDDTYVGLYERPEIANGLNADAFVSVHYNYVDNKRVSGVETLYADDPVRDCKRFATMIQEEMVKGLKANDRKIQNKPQFVVIRETKMPAVIAEVAFLSNPREARLAATPAYRQKAAQALFNGIKRYFDER